jgi:hypothetical protein
MVELRSCRHARQKEGHAVVVPGSAPLSHGGVDGVEDVVGIVEGVVLVVVVQQRVSRRARRADEEIGEEV